MPWTYLSRTLFADFLLTIVPEVLCSLIYDSSICLMAPKVPFIRARRLLLRGWAMEWHWLIT